jgi:hypothetical protein
MTHTISVGGRRICRLVGTPLFAAVFAFGGNALGYTAIAAAVPNSGTWDLEEYKNCMDSLDPVNTPNEIWAVLIKDCCIQSGGVWDEKTFNCHAPPGDSQGSRQLPGNIQIPSDIGSAPVVTQAPPRPIQVPSDIATAPVATQVPDCPPNTNCVPPPG